MKIVILAGGFGTRLAERTSVVPKPMVEIGGRPILWHIMNHYAHFGFKDFVIALGYKSEVIKGYFRNFNSLECDFKVDLLSGEIESLSAAPLDWNVTLVDTGIDTQTGGRIKRLQSVLGDQPFMLTYGDGVADIDLAALLDFHADHGHVGTLTAVHPKAHYGELEMDGGKVVRFMEKPEFRQSWINGGFMVFEPAIFELLIDDTTVLERGPVESLAGSGELMAFQHDGFWQCMDTLRDVRYLNQLWNDASAPWVF